jgi:putative tryptophan/tyrosine transport system substrate-binding protein
MTRRREFIALLGGAAVTPMMPWRRVAHAQSPLPVIGFLGAVSPDGFTDRVQGFRRGLKEAGYVEGENVAVEYRWAENQLDRLPGLAADLVRKRVAVIVATGGTAPAIAAKAATTTIPIVFTVPEDPVQLGLVASLSRPGGNLTGVNLFVGELVPKRLELLRELVPGMTRVAVFVNPANPQRAETHVKEAQSAARAKGLQVQIFNVGTGREINAAFATLTRERPDALFVSPDPFFVVRRVQLATLAARHAIPTSFSVRDLVDAGGLMSYGTNIVDGYRQAGVYAGRVLKGAKPADLPVVQSAKFELVINAQTALMLGLAVPTSLLASADEVIE